MSAASTYPPSEDSFRFRESAPDCPSRDARSTGVNWINATVIDASRSSCEKKDLAGVFACAPCLGSPTTPRAHSPLSLGRRRQRQREL
ncbi:hypothetical protein MTO96_000184 [Rhipicephalus appendiculatus]